MFVSSDRTGLLRERDPLTWANVLLLVAANVLRWSLRSLLMSTELGYGPVDAVRTGEHSRSLLTNEITGPSSSSARWPSARYSHLSDRRTRIRIGAGVPYAG